MKIQKINVNRMLYGVPVKILKGQEMVAWNYAHDEKIKNVKGEIVDGIERKFRTTATI